ncbi:MAG: hypothetical protein MK226_22675 [Saprospiraceae bacterium]|nr:hypothetical protein [Saprospiraceae bacterium]
MLDYLPTGELDGGQITLLCLEADEMWSFVGAKDCPGWIIVLYLAKGNYSKRAK